MPQEARDSSTGRLLHFVTVPEFGRGKSYFYNEDTRDITEAKAEAALDKGDHVLWPEGIEHWLIRDSVLDVEGKPVTRADGHIRTRLVKVTKDNKKGGGQSEEVLASLWEDPKDRGDGKGRGKGQGQEV